MNIAKIIAHEKETEEIKAHYFPKMLQLLRQAKINKGEFPDFKPAAEFLTVDAVWATDNQKKIGVEVSIHWRGDVYDNAQMVLTPEDWEQIKLES